MVGLEKILKTIRRNPGKTLTGLVLAGLIAVTSLKDNVHFGSIRINNPNENHYVWGIAPTTKIYGKESKGNIRTYSLFVGANELGDNSSIEGDMGVYSLLIGLNELGDNSSIEGDMGVYSLLIGLNELGDNSSIEGNMGAYCLFMGANGLGDNSSIRGDSKLRGIIAIGPRDKIKLGVNTEIKMDYTKPQSKK